MNDFLASAFRRYLLNPAQKDVFAHQLDRHGLLEEGRLLHLYDSKGTDEVELRCPPWQGATCFLGRYPPIECQSKFWFDPIECALMLNCPPLEGVSSDMHAWVSVAPVLRWQFQGFLACADLARRSDSLPFVADAFLTERFLDGGVTSPQTDIYEEEAWAYAAWFGKQLTGRFQWESLAHTLHPDQLDTVFHRSMQFWEAGDFRESLRLAFGQRTIAIDPIDQADLIDSGDAIPSEERVVYEAYYRSPLIGLSTCIPVNTGIAIQSPCFSEYSVLNNLATR